MSHCPETLDPQRLARPELGAKTIFRSGTFREILGNRRPLAPEDCSIVKDRSPAGNGGAARLRAKTHRARIENPRRTLRTPKHFLDSADFSFRRAARQSAQKRSARRDITKPGFNAPRSMHARPRR